MDKKIIKNILYVILFIFLAYLIFELILKLLGGSLTFESLVIGLLIANLGYSFYMKDSISKVDLKISNHISWHKGNEKQR